MYRYLDRAVTQLDAPAQLLVHAMRDWVAAAQRGRCPCRATAGWLAAAGLSSAASDFAIVMFTLNGDGLGTLTFSPQGCASIGEDEARLLALFDAPVGQGDAAVRRLAATLVDDTAVARLASAVSVVAAHLAASHISLKFG